MIKLAINGAMGRMGGRILQLAQQSPDFKINATFDTAGTQLSEKSLSGCDVLIDFSSPEGMRRCVDAALKTGVALVIGTTGLSAEDEKVLSAASKKIAILQSPNMSIGANFLFELARLAAQRLKEGYDIEIIEAHHRLKKDAPSGTAKKIAEVIAKAKGWDLKKVARYGRQGLTGERLKDEIGIHVIRAGDIVGEHSVFFSGPGETIELRHNAQSRDAFARGALVAALFISKKKSGRYSMADILR